MMNFGRQFSVLSKDKTATAPQAADLMEAIKPLSILPNSDALSSKGRV
jgi:hypothetical protein